jgi:hypothetical protein
VEAVGGVLQLKASSDMDSYERAVASQCADVGCTPEQLSEIKKFEDNALLENKLAISFLVAGGATLVTGGVMLWMNRGETIYPEDDGSLQERPQVGVVPLPGGGGAQGAVMTVSGRF